MRKDVKIGLAIAGVLFAVLIVYVFVPKGDTKDNTVADGSNPQQPTDPNSEDPLPPADPSLPPADPGAAPAVASGTPDAFAPGNNSADPGSASADAGKGDAGNTDWLKTFDTGNVVALESHPPLVAQSVTPTPGTLTDADHGPGGTGASSSNVVIPSVTDTPGGIAVTDAGATPGAIPTPTGPTVDTGASMTPRTPAGTTVAAPGARTHVMQQGETFSSVAKAVYGKSSYYLKIQKANPTINPNAVKVGTVINLPDGTDTGTTAAPAKTGTASGSREAAAPAVNPTSEYRIQPGDSLYKISVKLYGNGGHVDELYETNAKTIGDDPARLKVGTVLKLHDAPRVQR